jgi:peptide/nickel transport system permease protein
MAERGVLPPAASEPAAPGAGSSGVGSSGPASSEQGPSEQGPWEQPSSGSASSPPASPVPGSAGQAPADRWAPVRGPRLRRRWRRFRRRPMAVAGLLLVALFLALALVGPLVTGDPSAQDYAATLAAPSGVHPLGTDELGRDALTRICYGARTSLEAGVGSMLLAMVVGVPIGLVAGFYRRFLDPVIMRLVDTVLAFPALVFAVGLAAVLGPSLRNVILSIGISQLPGVVRITRGEVLAIRETDYVAAAVVDGATDARILSRYVLPGAADALIVQATVAIPAAVIGESTLSFLGLGVQPPTASWGVMLTDAQQFLDQAPWLAVWPGVMIAVTTLGFNLLGDGLRDVLDPRSGR